jgi:2-amino-4-hydroxy-6-hydroxymethyldihydropteridine diphosphokinase
MSKGIYILLGSNLGNREQNLGSALDKIASGVGRILAQSSLYQSEPWGISQQPQFLNLVAEINSRNDPQQVLQKLLAIETELGRERFEKWGPRTIDLDILFFNDRVIQTENLIVPHPGLPMRRFALVPLCEIAPNFFHPLLEKTCQQLLKECTDPLKVSPYVL